MKLKGKRSRDPAICTVMRCTAPAITMLDYGEEGEIPVCEAHQAPSGAATGAELQADLKREADDASGALAEIRDLEVLSEEDQTFAAEMLAEAKGSWKRLEERKKRATDPLNQALREIRGWFRAPQDFYAQCETILKGKIAAYVEAARVIQEQAFQQAEAAALEGDTIGVSQAMTAAITAGPTKIDGLATPEGWEF